MNSDWQDVGAWVGVICAIVAGFYILDFLRAWWHVQKLREEKLKEIRRRLREP
jgi:hypothetical protein